LSALKFPFKTWGKHGKKIYDRTWKQKTKNGWEVFQKKIWT
jgi:hypothetical protein